MTFEISYGNIVSVASEQRFGGLAQLGEHLPYKQRVTGSSPVVPTKKDQVERLGLFLSIAKATVYHHALACILSPKVYIISRGCILLSQ